MKTTTNVPTGVAAAAADAACAADAATRAAQAASHWAQLSGVANEDAAEAIAAAWRANRASERASYTSSLDEAWLQAATAWAAATTAIEADQRVSAQIVAGLAAL